MKLTYFHVYLSHTMWNHTKSSMKALNQPTSVFYNGRSLTDRSSLLKTGKTRETKTWITQHFELLWPIQGRTKWKSTSSVMAIGCQSRVKFWKNVEGEGAVKKDTATIMSFNGHWYGISVCQIWVVTRWFCAGTQNSFLWPCLFLRLLYFVKGPKKYQRMTES